MNTELYINYKEKMLRNFILSDYHIKSMLEGFIKLNICDVDTDSDGDWYVSVGMDVLYKPFLIGTENDPELELCYNKEWRENALKLLTQFIECDEDVGAISEDDGEHFIKIFNDLLRDGIT
jgi:hypothetical protein